MATVLQTDRAWPDESIERSVIEAAGHRFIAGPPVAPTEAEVETLVDAHRPDAIMTCWAPVSAQAIANGTTLRIVQRLGVGLDNIDVTAATESGTWVANVPDYCADEVSAHAIALLLAWARGVVLFDRSVKLGQWDPTAARLRRVSDLTVGIVGAGPIGRLTARRLHDLGCKVLVNSRSVGPDRIDLPTLLKESDAVVLHAPLTEATHHLIDSKAIAQMKDGAFLINVSRGALVETGAAIAGLECGKLSGVALDVVEGEPTPPAQLVGRPDVIATPHVAFSSDASLAELRRRAAEEVVRVLGGHDPIHPCNRPALNR